MDASKSYTSSKVIQRPMFTFLQLGTAPLNLSFALLRLG